MMAVADVLKTIAEDKSLVLFNAIALSNSDSDILISTLHLTRKQYYARLSALQKAGLVKREMAKYSLTTFGMILYHAQGLIEKALNQYWKIKAIDVTCNCVEAYLRYTTNACYKIIRYFIALTRLDLRKGVISINY